jgi:hypothetical protein
MLYYGIWVFARLLAKTTHLLAKSTRITAKKNLLKKACITDTGSFC